MRSFAPAGGAGASCCLCVCVCVCVCVCGGCGWRGPQQWCVAHVQRHPLQAPPLLMPCCVPTLTLTRATGVKRVTVYPSDYGLQKMAQEAAAGPQGVWQQQQQQHGSGDGSDGSDGSDDDAAMSDGGSADADADADADASDAPAAHGAATRRRGAAGAGGNAAAAAAGGADSGEEGAALDPSRVLAYERSKLRWFYAVVECDSRATAGALYAACDGLEFERSASKFDLRCACVCVRGVWVGGGCLLGVGGVVGVCVGGRQHIHSAPPRPHVRLPTPRPRATRPPPGLCPTTWT
jgi:hypothetical protein